MIQYISTKHITKAFKDTNLKIALKTNNTTAKLLKYKNKDDQKNLITTVFIGLLILTAGEIYRTDRLF